ncbi:hypothetical protein LJR220_001965 [Bradyrhizobium sp. LjRoot220]|uniref:hypothetical protein n=1 Tax=Bradyrhizobium sp. LjRoot220 TaxID=3342284 RepID=UPI003ECFB459
MNVSLLLSLERFSAPVCIEYLSPSPGKQKAPRDVVAGGDILAGDPGEPPVLRNINYEVRR